MTVEKFGAPNFDSLGNGSFLTFVASHDKACEALGGRLIGTNSSASHIGCVKTKVMNIIRQLNFDKRDDQVTIDLLFVSFSVLYSEFTAHNQLVYPLAI